jgi:hypothetical protein
MVAPQRGLDLRLALGVGRCFSGWHGK